MIPAAIADLRRKYESYFDHLMLDGINNQARGIARIGLGKQACPVVINGSFAYEQLISNFLVG